MILETFRLAGKNALVTGSSKGIGAAIAVALAEAGANVAVHGHSTSGADVLARVRNAGVSGISLQGNVADPGACDQLVERTFREFGSIDILVNNAGIIRRSPAEDVSAEDWRKVIDVNLNSVFRLSQLAGTHMLKQGSGKIINCLTAFVSGRHPRSCVRRRQGSSGATYESVGQ